MDGSKKPVVRVGLLGFGTIGTGVVGHLIGQRQLIADRLGCSIEIARIADLDIERDRGVKDWGHMIEGHGGMLDRLDSVSFAAPIFFHVVRYVFT